ncbi:biotin attachment protein [Micromonospora echinofusca]|uniref:Biotin attachment protein n=1 Tax=Micromonospora echinofusca TaxID=47858 RepID=A0ABS3VVA3_MICEH|nr:biotin attachment protein [Micromonospora echinofusca]
MKMPRVGETVDEVVVMEWEAEVGAEVAAGDVLLRVETDKAVVEVPSPVTGRLVHRAVAEGDEVTTGTVICAIES